MFDLLSRPLAFIPIKWPGLVEDADGNAKAVDHSIEVQVEMLDKAEFVAWLREGGESKEDTPEAELARFKRVARDWRGVKAGNKSLPFSDENAMKLLQVPGFATGFTECYLEAWQGRLAVREKNSEGSLDNGPEGERSAGTKKAETN